MEKVWVGSLLIACAMSACGCKPGEGALDASVDAGSFDGGRVEDGGTSDDAGGEWPDGGTGDGGASAPDEDAGCRLRTLTLLSTGDPGLESMAAGISPNGHAIGVNLATLDGSKNGVWFVDGGFITETGYLDITISAISDTSVCGAVIDGLTINPRQGYRRRYDSGPGFEAIEVLSNSFISSEALSVDNRHTTVGHDAYTAAEWQEDGGPGRRAPPVTLGAINTEFSAIDDDGLLGGNARTAGFTTFAFAVDGVAWRGLPCPRIDCHALSRSGDYLVGYAGGPNVPVRWVLSTGSYEELETRGDLIYGPARAARKDGIIGGALVFGNTQTPRDGVAAVWNQSRLIWLAPDAGPSDIKIVSIIGVAASGLMFAADCYDGDRRVACRVELTCK